MKKIIKSLFKAAGFKVTKRLGHEENYTWIQELKISTVIDIGANTGQFARFASKLLPKANIHSFEPIQSVYSELEVNTEHLNINTYHMALGAKNETSEINVNSFSPSSSLKEMSDLHLSNFSFADTTKKESIEIRKLDDVLDFSELALNILVKIDVQGFEDQVILGGQSSLCYAKIVICEISYLELYKNQKLFGSVYDQMVGLDFRFMGTYDQVYNYNTGQPIGGDAIFISNKF